MELEFCVVFWLLVLLCCAEEPPVGGTDIDLQLLEAAKAGDMELVKVCVWACVHVGVFLYGLFYHSILKLFNMQFLWNQYLKFPVDTHALDCNAYPVTVSD